MRLFIDDIRPVPDDTWHLAKSVNAAIRAIARFDFDEISLDHDISHQVSIGNTPGRPFPCEETFQAVAYFIGVKYSYSSTVEKRLDIDPKLKADLPKVPKLYVHSSNPVGATEIVDILRGYGLNATSTLGKAANRLELEV